MNKHMLKGASIAALMLVAGGAQAAANTGITSACPRAPANWLKK